MKYALIIGNNQYNDPKLARLKTPAADAQALANVLSDQNIGSFDKVISLVNKTESHVSRGISTFLTNKKPEDLVLVYFSGHGILDDRGRLFLALKDTRTSLLKATAIPAAFISDEMDSCRSRRQILILDCCNSGAFARGTKGEQKAVTEATFEGSGFGRVVLTASDSTQFALEGDQVIQTELSLFTHFLLEGLKTGEADTNSDGHVSLDEWYDYTYTQVLATTPKQTPNKWSYRQQGDLIIAKNPYVKKKVVQLPTELSRLLESPYSSVREVAIKELGVLLHSHDSELAGLARLMLEKLKEDDSRTVSLAAVKQLSELEKPIEEENLALENAAREQTEREATEKAEREKAKQAAREKLEHEVAEKAQREKIERETAEKTAREKAEREAAEKAMREEARRASSEKAKHEREELWAARKAVLEHTISNSSIALMLFIKRLKPKNSELLQRFRTHMVVGFVALVIVTIAAILSLRPVDLYFTSEQAEKAEIYRLTNTDAERVTTTPGNFESWGPALGFNSVYFTSNRDGKAEIYRLTNTDAERVTTTPGNFESWGPALGINSVYFTSNRDGKAEIYRLTNTDAERVTTTPGDFESWGPALGFNSVYFTSNRDGKAEIYRLTNTDAERVTTTPGDFESWGPVLGFNTMYFTSNRDGKAEIYRLTDKGVERVTTTPGNFESWGPIIGGQNLYFTSNRSGQNKVYVLKPQAIAILDVSSWTSILNDRLPVPPHKQ